jgi:ribosomal protein L31
MLSWAFTASSLQNKGSKTRILGKWRVQKMQDKTSGNTHTITKDYVVSFSANEFSISLDVNSCSGPAYITKQTFQTSPQKVKYTQVCCDTKEAIHLADVVSSSSLKSYSTKGDQLTISDDKYTLWLVKMK